MLDVARVLLMLLPMARRIARAARKDSPGGKRITVDEVIEILLGEAADLEKRINE